MADNRVQTLWNADDDRMKTLMYFLASCDYAFLNWDLESLYSSLHAVKRITSAKLSDDKEWKTEVTENFLELEKLRRKMNLTENPEEYHVSKIKFYNLCETLYMNLTKLMKEDGFFFREGRDPTKAALRV